MWEGGVGGLVASLVDRGRREIEERGGTGEILSGLGDQASEVAGDLREGGVGGMLRGLIESGRDLLSGS
jgi:hypothetical protein